MSTKAINQRGMAMVLELVLVAAVLAVVGYAGFHAYQSHHQAVTAADTTPNGKVTNAVNALNADAQAETDASAAEASAVQDADTSANDISNVEGSFDESQF